MEEATIRLPSVTCRTSTVRCKVCPLLHVWTATAPFSVNVVNVSEFIFGLVCTQVHLVLEAIAIEMTTSGL